jgi:hypothetical protein
VNLSIGVGTIVVGVIVVALAVVGIVRRNRIVERQRRILRRLGNFGRLVADAVSPTLVVIGIVMLSVVVLAGLVGLGQR